MPKSIAPCGGIELTTAQGTVTVIATGVCEISGAVTLFSWPCCGQVNVAVVCTTGKSGVAIDSRNPSRPAIVATQRVTRTSRATVSGAVGSVWVSVMAVLESVLAGSSRTR
ncbi:hypothetical protein MNVI_15310 [Mycobacterium noviomagense]|uniref:Uncharacterized protein n=1 Tax=Mycobacterium noviomagense TaxID=459858 RepID=A0A7I7PC68_9MYCO|nr:hypothetical protein MNVI_15310 [Mycobacterium noviomagense]